MPLVREATGAAVLSLMLRVAVVWRYALPVLTRADYRLLWRLLRPGRHLCRFRLKTEKYSWAGGRMIRPLWARDLLQDCGGSAVRRALAPAPQGRGKVASILQVKCVGRVLVTLVSIMAIFISAPELRVADDANANGRAGSVTVGTFNGRITTKFAETTGLLALTRTTTGATGLPQSKKVTDADGNGQGGSRYSPSIGSSNTLAGGADTPFIGGAVGYGLRITLPSRTYLRRKGARTAVRAL